MDRRSQEKPRSVQDSAVVSRVADSCVGFAAVARCLARVKDEDSTRLETEAPRLLGWAVGLWCLLLPLLF